MTQSTAALAGAEPVVHAPSFVTTAMLLAYVLAIVLHANFGDIEPAASSSHLDWHGNSAASAR